jgi:hypothetical protein
MIFCKIHQAPCFEKAELAGLTFMLRGLWKAMSGIWIFGDSVIWNALRLPRRGGFVADSLRSLRSLRPLRILCARCVGISPEFETVGISE